MLIDARMQRVGRKSAQSAGNTSSAGLTDEACCLCPKHLFGNPIGKCNTSSGKTPDNCELVQGDSVMTVGDRDCNMTLVTLKVMSRDIKVDDELTWNYSFRSLSLCAPMHILVLRCVCFDA